MGVDIFLVQLPAPFHEQHGGACAEMGFFGDIGPRRKGERPLDAPEHLVHRFFVAGSSECG